MNVPSSSQEISNVCTKSDHNGKDTKLIYIYIYTIIQFWYKNNITDR